MTCSLECNGGPPVDRGYLPNTTAKSGELKVLTYTVVHHFLYYAASHLMLTKELRAYHKDKPQASVSEHGLSHGRPAVSRRNALITAKNVEIGPLMKRKLSLPPINTHHSK